MRIIAVVLMFVFVSFVGLQSISVIWQDDESTSYALTQAEEEDDQEEKREEIKHILRILGDSNDGYRIAMQQIHAFDKSDDQFSDEVNLMVPFSPPERIKG